jgi:hypothetical protein
MSTADASVTPTFLAVSPAACALALVVTPVSTDTVHTAAAASVDVPAVRVSVDVAVPELALVAVNVVEPQPADAPGDARVPRVNVGSTSAIESAAFSGTFSANLNVVADSEYIRGSASSSRLMLSADTFTSVDTPIAPAPILLTDARVTAAVRLLKSATCAPVLVVTPAPTVTAHCEYALRVATPAVSVSVAVAVPEFVLVAVNVVVPHPLMLIDAGVPTLNVGTTSAMLSAASSGAFSANMNVTEDSCCATALAITSELNCIAGVGCTTAVDDAIAVVAEAMSTADASVTPTFLAVSPAACALALVVTPVSTDTMHTAAAASVDVPAVRVSVDVAVPELALVAVNVVEPQPADAPGDASVPRVNVGSTSAIESAAFSGAFSANENAVRDRACT